MRQRTARMIVGTYIVGSFAFLGATLGTLPRRVIPYGSPVTVERTASVTSVSQESGQRVPVEVWASNDCNADGIDDYVVAHATSRYEPEISFLLSDGGHHFATPIAHMSSQAASCLYDSIAR